MALLVVSVKRAQLVGEPERFNTYVTLKLPNVKSTTACLKGAGPTWQQDFMFEVGTLEPGLLLELWNKGIIWDTIVGYVWIPLNTIATAKGAPPSRSAPGSWFNIDAELALAPDGTEVQGTRLTTGHKILLDTHFETTLSPDTQPQLHQMNSMHAASGANNSAANRSKQKASTSDARELCRTKSSNSAQSQLSDDSDYTSDIVAGLNPTHPNSSASHFRHPGPLTSTVRYPNGEEPYYPSQMDTNATEGFYYDGNDTHDPSARNLDYERFQQGFQAYRGATATANGTGEYSQYYTEEYDDSYYLDEYDPEYDYYNNDEFPYEPEYYPEDMYYEMLARPPEFVEYDENYGDPVELPSTSSGSTRQKQVSVVQGLSGAETGQPDDQKQSATNQPNDKESVSAQTGASENYSHAKASEQPDKSQNETDNRDVSQATANSANANTWHSGTRNPRLNPLNPSDSADYYDSEFYPGTYDPEDQYYEGGIEMYTPNYNTENAEYLCDEYGNPVVVYDATDSNNPEGANYENIQQAHFDDSAHYFVDKDGNVLHPDQEPYPAEVYDNMYYDEEYDEYFPEEYTYNEEGEPIPIAFHTDHHSGMFHNFQGGFLPLGGQVGDETGEMLPYHHQQLLRVITGDLQTSGFGEQVDSMHYIGQNVYKDVQEIWRELDLGPASGCLGRCFRDRTRLPVGPSQNCRTTRRNGGRRANWARLVMAA